KFAAARCVANSGGPIPWHSEIPLHVRVVDKQLTVFVESHIEGIAIPSADQLPALSQGVDFRDPSSGSHAVIGVASRVFNQRRHIVFLPDRREPVGVHWRNIGVVSRNHIKRFPVWCQYDAVWVMLTLAVELFEHGDGVVMVVAFSILEPVEASAFFKTIVAVMDDHYVQNNKRVQQTLRVSPRNSL